MIIKQKLVLIQKYNSQDLFPSNIFNKIIYPLPIESYREIYILVWKRLTFLTIQWKYDKISILPYSSLSNFKNVEAVKKCLHFWGNWFAIF
jgi:hypothetical protein